jgi:hypothetical protein
MDKKNHPYVEGNMNITELIQPYFIVNTVIGGLFLIYWFAAIKVHQGSMKVILLFLKKAYVPATILALVSWTVFFFTYYNNASYYSCLNYKGKSYPRYNKYGSDQRPLISGRFIEFTVVFPGMIVALFGFAILFFIGYGLKNCCCENGYEGQFDLP